MESMMYNEGQQTQLIKFADYVRWRKAVNVALGIPAEDQTELNEAQSRFHEHEAQWRLNKVLWVTVKGPRIRCQGITG